MKLIEKIKAKTPKKNKVLSGVTLGLGILTAGVEFATPDTIDKILAFIIESPEEGRIKYALIAAGVFVVMSIYNGQKVKEEEKTI